MKIVRLLLVGGLLAGWPAPPAFSGDTGGTAPTARFHKAVAELAGELNNEVCFYGQVVDLDGAPVAGAVVKMSVRIAGAIPPRQEFERFQVTTDGAGRFFAEAFGDVIGVNEIVREGYDYHYRYNPTRDFKTLKKEKLHGPGFEPDKPFTFRIRKLAPPAFVVLHNMTFGQKSGTSTELDLIRREWVEPSRLFTQKMMFPDWHPDLRLSVEGEPGKLRLILETLDPDSGLVVAKHEFFEQMTEAPEHGYRQRLEIPVKSGESPVDAYVKCQGGLFYAKINIEFSEPKPGVVAINATAFVNLAGGRGLEYIPAIESQYDWETNIDHTRKEIRRADLLSGRPIEMPRGREK